MAHNLATIDGQTAMAYMGETPWHRLGMRLESGAVVVDALTAAKLDWTVDVQPMFLSTGARVPHAGAVVRSIGNVVLGTVSEDYRPIQNADAFGMFQDVITERGLTIESAGALGNGERCWMLLKLPTTIEPAPGDRVTGYAVAVTSHDGHGAFHFRPTPIRVVCQNTLNASLRTRGGVFSVAHAGNVAARIAEARRIIDGLMEAMTETGDTFASLAARRMTIAETRAYIASVFPASDEQQVARSVQDKRDQVFNLVWSGVGADLAGTTETDTTAWGVYNAVTEFVDHVKPAAAKDDAGVLRASRSAIFGQGDALKALALTKARQLVMA